MRTLRIALALLALSAPAAAAQLNITREAIPASRPEVTHHVTATKSLHYGETWYEFNLAEVGDITATDRTLPQLDDGRVDLNGAVVQVHGIDGFPAGSTWQDYVVRTDMLWFSEYDWVYRENTSYSPRPSVEVATSIRPLLLCFDVRHYYGGHDVGHGTGIGLPLYGVSFGLGHQDLPSGGAFDGAVNWAGSSGAWAGEINNTNPTADDQEMSGDYWTARRLWAEYGDTDAEVPVYFVPETSWSWSDPGYGHPCVMSLPEPGCIGCEPQPMSKDMPCGGHASTWVYGQRMDVRGTGGPSGGGWRMRIRIVPATQGLTYDPEPDWLRSRRLLSKALLMSPRSEWPKLIEGQDRIVSVDPTERVDLRTGERSAGCVIGWREELPD